jgi:peptide deformylase
MTARRVLRMGHPVLLERSQPVPDFSTPELQVLIKDMQDTMAAEEGAGIAAPQIGVLWRVVMFGIDHNPRYPHAEPVPFTILINPEITVLDKAREEGWEGCLSVPGMRGLVPRYRRIAYSGYDAQGQYFEREAEGFHARVVQHEVDHLDGILYPLRIEDMTQFGFKEEVMQTMACEKD